MPEQESKDALCHKKHCGKESYNYSNNNWAQRKKGKAASRVYITKGFYHLETMDYAYSVKPIPFLEDESAHPG